MAIMSKIWVGVFPNTMCACLFFIFIYIVLFHFLLHITVRVFPQVPEHFIRMSNSQYLAVGAAESLDAGSEEAMDVEDEQTSETKTPVAGMPDACWVKLGPTTVRRRQVTMNWQCLPHSL